MTTRRAFFAQSAGAAAFIALPGLTHKVYAQVQGRDLVIGSQSMPTLNPAIQSGNATGTPGSQIFAGLVLLDEKFEPRPYLAKSWAISDDGLEYRFTLVDGATFHDGKPIKASDVAFSIKTVAANHPLMSVTYASILDSVSAESDSVVLVKLKAPFTGLFGLLTPVLTPILPEHVFGADKGPIRENPANNAPVGSGPYAFGDWSQGEHVILTRYDGFFGEKPIYDRVVFRLTEDALTRALMLEKGEIDYNPFSYIRVNDLKRLEKNDNLSVTLDGYAAIGPINYLELNLRIEPFSDLRVRRAIAHAIDKNFISNVLHQGLSTPLHGPFHSASSFYDKASVTVYETDLDKANALLDEAGLPANSDGIRGTYTLDVPTFEPDSQALVAEYLKSQLKKIGFDIQIRKSSDLADWMTKIGAWDYQMTMNSTFNWSDPTVGVHRSFLTSNIKKRAWTNTQAYSNPDVDELLRLAAIEPDIKKRKEIYGKFQKIVTDELAYIWTNEGLYTTVYSNGLKDIPLGAFGALAPFNTIAPKN